MTRALLALAVGFVGCASPTPAVDKALVMLAIDGLDPVLTQRWMDEGRLPHLKALAERGSFRPLATSDPPQSPVAWSSFITGLDVDGHGIYDFLHRDPETLIPYLSTSRIERSGMALTFGDFSLPLGGGVINLRAGVPFWHRLQAAGVPVTVVRVPAEYPPRACADCPRGSPEARVLSGMGTPDLLGTPGIFQLFTTRAGDDENPSGGRIHRLQRGDVATSRLDGPPHPLSASGRLLSIELRVEPDESTDTALIQVGGAERLLRVGEWSDWVPVRFPLGGPWGSVKGMVRLHLQSVSPEISLYVSPVNMDPLDPAQPLSTPTDYAVELAEDVGRYYTQGMPEDTKALSAGVLSPEEFLDQSALVWAERRRMLDRELSTFEGGFLFVYFSSVDLVSHMFFRELGDPSHRDHDAIAAAYERVDEVVGDVVARLGPGASLVVMSDHGFAPYDFKVNLNERLAAGGFLARRRGATTGTPMADIDWTRTRAYSVGLNLLYLNRAGRESGGIVTVAERPELLDAIERDLKAWRNPETGEAVVTSVSRPQGGAHPGRAPDLIVGYNRGHRASEQSALGVLGTAVVERNTGRWSGDHCMDPALVPGVLITNVQPFAGAGGITDLGPATLDWFGVSR
jgi:predicted AlkP superfamily phosphohydrolase/phosphomutase